MKLPFYCYFYFNIGASKLENIVHIYDFHMLFSLYTRNVRLKAVIFEFQIAIHSKFGLQIMKNATAQVTRCDTNLSEKRFPENNINYQ